MMNEHPYFHWELLRQPLQTPQFGMPPSFFDVNSILELRKEKSRDAARSRRGKENYEFYELAKLLPLPAAITSQLDKASIIRLTISYLKLRDFSSNGDPQWTRDGVIGPGGGAGKNGKVLPGHRRMDMLDSFESQHGTHILQSLDGFAFILANDGRFLYISETVSIYLGLSQVEMAGSSIFDYVHHDDHGQLSDYLGMCSVPGPGPENTPPTSGSEEAGSPGQRPQTPSEKGYSMVNQWDKNIYKSFSIRMKSTLTKRGAHVKTSGYRVLHILGSLRHQSIFGHTQATSQSESSVSGVGTSNNDTPPMGLVGMAIALPPPTVSELRLEMDTFIMRLNPDFKVVYCDHPVVDLMDLTPEDVADRLLYDLCHVADLKMLQQAHQDIMTKGQVLTDYWRLLNRHGGYTWVQTCFTTLFNNKTTEEQTVLAVNYVISEARSSGCCVDLWQMTGDATSSKNSYHRCPVRDQLLQGLHKKDAKKLEKAAPNNNHGKSCFSAASGQKTNEIDKTNTKVVGDDASASILLPSTNTCMEDSSVNSSDTLVDKVGEAHISHSNSSSACDNKINNNRRKMDNPRKRKKSEDDSGHRVVPNKTHATGCSGTTPHAATLELNPTQQDKSPQTEQHSTGTNSTYFGTAHAPSPSPEDLSVKKSKPEVVSNLHQSLPNIHLLHGDDDDTSTLLSRDPTVSKLHTTNRKQMTSTSVHDLEAAMNRHLPRIGSDSTQLATSASTQKALTVPHDFVTPDSKSVVTQPFSSTTQSGPWVPLSPRTPPATTGDMLPTPDLLRCLYSTRESVIKTNSRPHVSYLNGETPSSLLTPPEPEASDTLTQKYQRRTHQLSKRANDTEYPLIQHPHTGSNGIQSFKGNDLNLRESVYIENSIKDRTFPFLPYKDHLSTAYIDHFTSASGAGYKDHMTSYKDFPQFKDIVPAFTIPNLVTTGSRFHQSYPHVHHQFPLPVTSTTQNQLIADPCSISPPVSNSPDAVNKSSQNQHHLQQQQQQQPQQQQQQQQQQTQTNPNQYTHNDLSQPFDTSSFNSSEVTGSSYNNNLATKNISPIQFHHPHHHCPSAPSPHSGVYHQYRQQDYTTSPFHHPGQDITKGGYYAMAPSPVPQMYMEFSNTSGTQYEAFHRPTLTWY